MIPWNAQLWLAALRSGKYQQSVFGLRTDDDDGGTGFCCLGVACDVSGQGRWIGAGRYVDKRHLRPDGEITEDVWSHSDEAFLTPAVQYSMELSTPSGELKLDNGEQTSLSALNDQGMPFAAIANVVELYADQLFKFAVTEQRDERKAA